MADKGDDEFGPIGQPGDPFFHIPVHLGSEWNACIGPQGSEENYVDGYMEAAIELANAVIDKRMYVRRDTLVLPTLYNARHAVELSLKYILRALHEAGVIAEAPGKHHEIMMHWEALGVAIVCDESLRKDAAALGPYVASLAKIDLDGQELRYHENQGGKKSLEDRALANFLVIRESLAALSEILTHMKYRVMDYGRERKTGTYTAECSRSDLLEIARILPKADQWNTAAFDEAKAQVMERYGLDSNKKFIRAVDAIKACRATRSALGIECELLYLTDESAIHVVQQWHKLHPPRIEKFDAKSESVDEMLERNNQDRDIFKVILDNLSGDELADLDTIFYIGRDKEFCEYYEQILDGTKKDHKLEKNPLVPLAHIMTKVNFADGLVRGLQNLGRPGLAERLLTIQPE
jgi:hypothetical protein